MSRLPVRHASLRPMRPALRLGLWVLLAVLAPLATSGAQNPPPKLSTQLQQNADPKVRAQGEAFLGGVITPAVDGLSDVLTSRKATTAQRLEAIARLAELGPQGQMGVNALLKALRHDDFNVRLAAVKALSAIGVKSQAVSELKPLLKDSKESVRLATVELFVKLGPEARSAVPDLIGALGDARPSVQKQAILALQEIGQDAHRSIPDLINLLKPNEAKAVRMQAVKTLGQFGRASRSAVAPLINLLDGDDEELRVVAMIALGEIGPEAQAAVPALQRQLKQSNHSHRAFAARALGEIGEPASKAISVLTETLADDNTGVRQAVAVALGKIGAESRSALPKLVENLQESNRDVKLSTATAIAQIAENLQDKSIHIKRSALREAIIELEKALKIVEVPNAGFDEDTQGAVRRSLKALQGERDRRPLERVGEWSKRNWIVTAMLIYGTVTPLFWLIILGWKPLWVLKVNDTLQPYTDFEIPLPTGNSLRIPLRFVLFLGWFRHHPRVLDAWVEQQIPIARYAFTQKSTVRDRQVYIPIPVVLDGKVIPEVGSPNLQTTFGDGRQCLSIWGEGGSGKTSLACHLAKWAMSSRKSQRLAKHKMLPILIEQELDFRVPANRDPFREAIRGQLQALVDSSHPLSDDFLDRLLRLRRILVIVDHLSEMSPESRAAIRPGHPDFPANALIVTSRAEEALDRVPKTVIKPLRIEGNRLSSFLEAYLIKCQKRDLFTDAEYFDACSQLSKMVGQRNVTVLLAKLYAEQMIAIKSGVNDGHLPDNIPSLMLSYLNELNRDHHHHEPDNRRIHQLTKIIAWECLKQTYRPAPAKRQTLIVTLQRELRVDEAQAIAWLNHLENRLRIIHTVGPAQDQICFALDPLAECLAALHWVEYYGHDVTAWNQWFMQADRMPGNPDSIQGFLLAMRDCCLHRTVDLEIPEFVIDELGRRVGLSTEMLRRSQVEQQIARLHPRILQGDLSVRLRALRAVAELGIAAKPLLPLLLKALEDPDWRIRYETAKTIGYLGTEARSAIPALNDRLHDRDRRVACESIASLGKVGNAAIPSLINALDSQIVYVRSCAAWVLAGFEANARSAVPALIETLHDSDWQVQWVAAYALGCIGVDAKPAVYGLIEACKGDYHLVAKEASRALWRINGEEAGTIVAALGQAQR
jgi:HEAT repeat protein